MVRCAGFMIMIQQLLVWSDTHMAAHLHGLWQKYARGFLPE